MFEVQSAEFSDYEQAPDPVVMRDSNISWPAYEQPEVSTRLVIVETSGVGVTIPRRSGRKPGYGFLCGSCEFIIPWISPVPWPITLEPYVAFNVLHNASILSLSDQLADTGVLSSSPYHPNEAELPLAPTRRKRLNF